MTYIEKIQLFIQGKLSIPEQNTFKEEINNNPTLRKEVEDYKKIFSGFKGLQQEDFEVQVREWTAQLPEPQKPTAKLFWLSTNIRKIAIAVLVLLVSTLVIKNINAPNKNDLLLRYAGNNYIKPKLDINRDGEGSLQLLQKAKAYFFKDSFQLSINQAKNIDFSDSLYLVAQTIIGHSHYRMDDYKNAEKTLLSIPGIKEKSNNPFLYNAGWVLILSQLQIYIEEQTEKETLIQTIDSFIETEPSNTYKVKAEALKELLN